MLNLLNISRVKQCPRQIPCFSTKMNGIVGSIHGKYEKGINAGEDEMEGNSLWCLWTLKLCCI